MAKNSPFICPFCGSYNTHIIDTDVIPSSRAKHGVTIYVDQECDDCEGTFSDYFDAAYDGYVTNSAAYDENGNIVPQ